MRSVLVFGLGASLAAVGGYFAYVQLTKPPFALEVDATRDTTDIASIFHRIRVTNVGPERLTGVTAELGILSRARPVLLFLPRTGDHRI